MTDHFLYRAYNAKRKDNWAIKLDTSLTPLLQKLPKQNIAIGELRWPTNFMLRLKRADDPKGLCCGSIYYPLKRVLIKTANLAAQESAQNKRQKLSVPQLQLGVAKSHPDNVIHYHRYSTELLEKILPQLPQDFLHEQSSLRLHKLVMQGKDGQVELYCHPDHHYDQVATLLLEVRSRHTGGDVVLEKDGHQSRWSLSEKRQQKVTRWMMFSSEVNYRVEPVASGVRMVLEFDVLKPAGSYYSHSPAPIEEVVGSNEESYGRDRSEYEYGLEMIDKDSVGSSDYMIWDGWEHFTEYFNPRLIPLRNNLQFGLDPIVMNRITAYLNRELSEESLIAIPLYYRYTTQCLLPEQLEPFDAQVFQALVERGFGVAIAMAELTLKSDHRGRLGNHRAEQVMNIYDFPLTMHYYDKNSKTTKTTEITEITEWSYEAEVVYCYSGMEQTTRLEDRSFLEESDRHEARPGIHRFLCGVMVLFPLTPEFLRQQLTKK